MSDDEKTGFAAIDQKAHDAETKTSDVTDANSQTKNEHTETKDDTLGLTAASVPENLQTTSAHRNDAANANTMVEIKAAHDAALAELRDAIDVLRSDMEAEVLKLSNKFGDLTKTADKVSSGDGDDSGSLALNHRFEQIERAVGIRRPEPEQSEEVAQ